eukprot:14142711-Alexandrium_andersonii.AAC.1
MPPASAGPPAAAPAAPEPPPAAVQRQAELRVPSSGEPLPLAPPPTDRSHPRQRLCLQRRLASLHQ